MMKKNKEQIVQIITKEFGGRKPQLLRYISPESVDTFPVSARSNLTVATSLLMYIGQLNNGGLLMSIESARCNTDSLKEILDAIDALYDITPYEGV